MKRKTKSKETLIALGEFDHKKIFLLSLSLFLYLKKSSYFPPDLGNTLWKYMLYRAHKRTTQHRVFRRSSENVKNWSGKITLSTSFQKDMFQNDATKKICISLWNIFPRYLWDSLFNSWMFSDFHKIPRNFPIPRNVCWVWLFPGQPKGEFLYKFLINFKIQKP